MYNMCDKSLSTVHTHRLRVAGCPLALKLCLVEHVVYVLSSAWTVIQVVHFTNNVFLCIAFKSRELCKVIYAVY